MKINLFKYPIGTVVRHDLKDETEVWGHVTGFHYTIRGVMLVVKWYNSSYEDTISPELVTTYNDL
jgi:hypothetical protein